ncbi:hypothetical protein C8R43DRAFT_945173 [Mycena crocata]|nr:hypothetical protein C8R43DRAFT_945173 [Mycena crocata]
MSPKQVHWKLPVEEDGAPEHTEVQPRPSPLPSPPSTPASSPSRLVSVLHGRPLAPALESNPRLIPHPPSLSQLRTSPLPSPPSTPPPPTPFLHDRPLPSTLEIHPLLTPPHALQLDFSLPSDAFRKNPQLTEALLAAPACTPPHATLCLRIAAGAFRQSHGVEHNPRGQPVTVGDVLTAVQRVLRAYDHGTAPPAAAPYMRRRIETVNDCSYYPGTGVGGSGLWDAKTASAERAGEGRVVDRLLGYTLFAGLTVEPDKPDNCWQLHLAIPERYKYL